MGAFGHWDNLCDLSPPPSPEANEQFHLNAKIGFQLRCLGGEGNCFNPLSYFSSLSLSETHRQCHWELDGLNYLVQSAFPGANWGFLVTLLKREMAKKERRYYNLGCTTLESNPHRTICASQTASQKTMGTPVAWVFYLKTSAKLKARLFLKLSRPNTNTKKRGAR